MPPACTSPRAKVPPLSPGKAAFEKGADAGGKSARSGSAPPARPTGAPLSARNPPPSAGPPLSPRASARPPSPRGARPSTGGLTPRRESSEPKKSGAGVAAGAKPASKDAPAAKSKDGTREAQTGASPPKEGRKATAAAAGAKLPGDLRSSKDRDNAANAAAERAASDMGVATDVRGEKEVCGPAMTLEEAVTLGARLDTAGLPHKGRAVDLTRALLAANAPRLVLTFLHYSRLSGVATLREATRFRLAGLQQLARDSGLDSRDFDLNSIARVLSMYVEDAKVGKSAAAAKDVKDSGMPPEHAELRLEQFMQLLVQLAFCWVHPRHGHALFDAPRPNQSFVNQTSVLGKIDETTAVPNAVRKLMESLLPKMKGGECQSYRERLQRDVESQAVLASYKGSIETWAEKLRASFFTSKADPLEHWSKALDAKRCLGTLTVPITDRNGQQRTYKAGLSAAQARVCFLEAQSDVSSVALGRGASMFDTGVVMEALARCGEVKYGAVEAMGTLAKCVGGMVRNVIGRANEIEVLTEAVVGKDLESTEGLAERQEAARAGAWTACWKKMVFKDMVGYPLWEQQLHDVLQPVFPDLQSIFVHYCGSSIQGTMTISSATKLGVMELLTLAKDTQLCNKQFNEDELTRQFATANAQTALAESGSAERHATVAGVKKKQLPWDPIREAIEKRLKRDTPPQDQQLNLFEFVNFLVRVAFWRANPQWGSKYNKKDLTPVPEATQILLDGFLPRARRDTSGEFRELLAEDMSSQHVLSEYREKVHDWLRQALRKDSGKADGLNAAATRLTYGLWVSLMDGPDPEQQKASAARAACPKMVGLWSCRQESQITGDERVLRRNQLELHAKLSIPQVRWNFLRSQRVEQMGEGEVGDDSNYGALDYTELLECLARCAVDMFADAMKTWVPSKDAYAFTMAEAIRAFLRVLLWEASVEYVLWETMLIKAERFDAELHARPLPTQTDAEYQLFRDCWKVMPLMDLYGFPLWEKGVHDVLQAHFIPIMRIFAHYCKGISGIDSAADALEMELDEFHDFVKAARIETPIIRFDTMCTIFAKANATNTQAAYEQRKMERRNSTVQAEIERNLDEKARKAREPAHKQGNRPGKAVVDYHGEFAYEGDRFKKPDNRLTLSEFLCCLVRISFLRANPKHGQYDHKGKVDPLPGCLEKMIVSCLLPNATQDASSLFREELQADRHRLDVFEANDEELRYWFHEVTRLTGAHGNKKNAKNLNMETYLDIVRGFLTFHKKPGWSIKKDGEGGLVMKRRMAGRGEVNTLSEFAIVGDCTVQRESDITGDERCKEKFTCRLSVLECKYAFLNSQSLEQMRATEASDDSDQATLDFDEFKECLARCAHAKYGEIKRIPPARGLQGLIDNLFGRASDEAIIRDATYIYATRFDWADSRPLPGQSLALHRQWRDCWQNLEIADLHHFPLWEKEVHDTLQPVFGEIQKIFANYCKSIGGITAEDAVEMTMTEFKKLVKDVHLETRDFKFDVMQNLFKKANALNNNAAHFQRKQEAGNSDVKQGVGSKVRTLEQNSKRRSMRAHGQRDQEMDNELVLYEFVELLVRIAFWRANPYHGLLKLATKLIPLPDCLYSLLHEVILPNAKRDETFAFKERLRQDVHLQAALRQVEPRLRSWFNVHTQSMWLREQRRALQFQQWQDLMKRGWGSRGPHSAQPQVGFCPGQLVGTWEINQDSEITGDERCRDRHSCALSFPTIKLAFIASQSLDQMTIGQAKSTDEFCTLDYSEFEECLARCALDKYRSVKGMRDPAMITAFVANLLGEENTEESMNTATLIRYPRFEWRREAQPLEGQPLREFKRWLGVWQRLELSDLFYFPIWEKEVHDCLQRHFHALSLIFLAYARSALGSDSAEDATEMEMAEFYDFVQECRLETKQINFDMMTNQFIKVNAVNSAAAREQHHDIRRSAGTKMDGKAAELERVKGNNDGTEAVKDQELVLYEFVGLLVRIAFQRANPTFGNFGNKKPVVHLPGCLERMIVDEVLPRARQDSSVVFRQTVMQELSVLKVLEQYGEKLRVWYNNATSNDTAYFDRSEQMGMEQWLRICDQMDLVGIWRCYRESDITGDPATKTEYQWSLSMLQVKLNFADSQDKLGELGAAKASAGESITTLSFQEWLENLARCGVDKYRAVKDIGPAQAVAGFIQNVLNEASPDQVVLAATRISAKPYDAQRLARKLSADTDADLAKWLDCWSRIELMDMHLWPTWDKEVHDILHPLFKELQLIFLAYTRSISEDSAEDAMEMSMDEFHDFVVDVGLETKKYKFEVMQNQFVKANATNVAQVRQQRVESRRDAQAKGFDREVKSLEKTAYNTDRAAKVKQGTDGQEVKKDAELVLYEWLNMLVRIAFWRANPDFGLWVDKDGDGVKDQEDHVPVPMALSEMLNKLVLPRAKRENSAAFRQKEMRESSVRSALHSVRPRLKVWYTDLQQSALSTDNDTKLGFEEWVKAIRIPHEPTAERPRTDLCGEWEVEQISEITGDPSTRGTQIKCRLSVPTCKAAFMDSQKVEQLGVGQAATNSAQTVLSFDEFIECIARCAIAKYFAVKQMDNGQKILAFVRNLVGEASEETCMLECTAIKAVRYDLSKSKPLPRESAAEHAAFVEAFRKCRLDGVYGWPLWEEEVHKSLHLVFGELSSIFRAYSKSLGEAKDSATARTMSLEEFHDFVVDVGLETDNGAPFNFELMKPLFLEANKSGKGMAGPEADAELEMHEFMSVLVRVCFWRLNPEYGEVTMEHQSELLPVPQCLRQAFDEHILPLARRDDAEQFRLEVMTDPGVRQALYEFRLRLQRWFAEFATADGDTGDGEARVSMGSWIKALESLQGIGTFVCERTSDMVGDERAGDVLRCRLSLPQARGNFVMSQRETGDKGQDTTLDFDELLECITRCGVDKYRGIVQMKLGAKVRAMVGNLLGDVTEEVAMEKATHVSVPRFDLHAEPKPPGLADEQHAEWKHMWSQMSLSDLHGFPLWEREVYQMLQSNLGSLKSIFAAYAASSPEGDSSSMDFEELHDFVIETSLPIEGYGWLAMKRQYLDANLRSNDEVLELHEFLVFLVRVSFYRANPRYGLRIGAAAGAKNDGIGGNLALSAGHAALKGQGQRGGQRNPALGPVLGRETARRGSTGAQREQDASAIEMPLPGCLFDMLNGCVMPHARRDGDVQYFTETILPSKDVREALRENAHDLANWYELVSQGMDHLNLNQWIRALDGAQMITDLCIKNYVVRTSQPSARAAFIASAKNPQNGLTPHELPPCVARLACDKYRAVDALSHGGKVRAFIKNLFGVADEQEVLTAVPEAPPIKGRSSMKALETAPTEEAYPARKVGGAPTPPPAGAAGAGPTGAPWSHLGAAAGAAPSWSHQFSHEFPDLESAQAAAAAVLDAEALLDVLDQSGTGIIMIAELIEALCEHHPVMAEALQSTAGTILFNSLNKHGDDSITRAEVHEAFAQAILKHPPLQDIVSKVGRY